MPPARCGAADARPGASDQRNLAIQPSHLNTRLTALFPHHFYPGNVSRNVRPIYNDECYHETHTRFQRDAARCSELLS
jgi:hypothetical protein